MLLMAIAYRHLSHQMVCLCPFQLLFDNDRHSDSGAAATWRDSFHCNQIPVQVAGVDQPLNIDPFVYRSVKWGRNENPGSFSFLLGPVTVPLVVPSATYSAWRPRHPSRHPHGRWETTSEEDIETASQRLSQQPPMSTRTSSRQGSLQQAIRRTIPTPVIVG